MNRREVAQALAGRLQGVPDVNVYDHPPGNVQVPALVVGYPISGRYDLTFGDAVQMTFPVFVIVASNDNETAADELDAYLSTEGVQSVKLAVDGDSTLAGQVASTAVVGWEQVDDMQIADVPHLAAVIEIEVIG